MTRSANKKGVWVGLGLALVIGLAVLATIPVVKAAPVQKSNASSDTASKAIFSIEGMSCGGCVATITQALSVFDGIEDVWVDVASGKAEVVFQPDIITDVAQLAAAITESGYPAKVVRVFTADALRREQFQAQAKSATAIAAVGDVEISRADFNTELAHTRNRYEELYGSTVFSDQQGRQLLDNVKVQITRSLIAEAIQLHEIQRAAFAVDSETVDRRYGEFLEDRGTTRSAFEADLAKKGYPADYFQKKFRRRVLISSYMDMRILNGLTGENEKQQRYNEWFANAQLLAEVTYYDKELERQMQAGNSSSGCGNSCSVSK